MVMSQTIMEPKAPTKPRVHRIHNHVRHDDYYWMKRRDSKPVLKYIKEENKLSTTFFNSYQDTIQRLLQEFENRIDPNEQYSPFEMNSRMFQSRMIVGQDYGVVVEITTSGDTIFFDENQRAKGYRYYELVGFNISPDNKILAVAEDYVGRRQYKISFIDLETGKELADHIKSTSGFFSWGNDSKTIYYSTYEKQSLRSNKVFCHQLGTPPDKDIMIFEEKDKSFNLSIVRPNLNNNLFIISNSNSTTKYFEIEKSSQIVDPIPFMETIKGHEYSVYPHSTGYYILSNYNADNRQVLFSKNRPQKIEDCEIIIPHNPEVLIEQLDIRNNFLIVQQRSEGLDRIKIYDLKTQKSQYIQFAEETSSIRLFRLDNIEANYFYYSYNSTTTPRSTYKYDVDKNEHQLIFRYQMKDSSFAPDNYISERLWFVANDSTQIPATITYKKGTDLKNAPCLLYGYGSYGVTIPDEFDPFLLSLLDRGYVYVNAHVRGSRYLGESWYQEGKFLNKKNSFTDFIAVAEQLSKRGYCHPKKLYIQGTSAGGLLVGTVMNMAPQLFKGVIANVPFVDVVTTMLDEKIPLTVEEFEEWGNPKNVKFYHYMLSYSPYDNIHRIDYPHILITTGYHDSQVQYWEPLKWIAKLRALRNNNNLLFLECNMDAGHGGGSGRSVERLERAKKFAFILSLENMD